MVETGEWYPFGERDNPALKAHRIIDGRRFFRGKVTTNKADARKSAERLKKNSSVKVFVRIIPLTLWGKRKGFYEISDNRRCYVVYHSYSDQRD